ncbi:S-layer homology domain-containing protein [Paenibacillus pinisoli]|uniref:S-layer homology domain-containing protein n=2 Tax=Paenibacillus pinisoli TaxID=1276110 RepID=A0A3A6PI98_9BACL|nr:S-layer homology domain-containing protein [Paenibacillus pinisoli]
MAWVAGRKGKERTSSRGQLLCLVIACTLFALPSGSEAASDGAWTTAISASEEAVPDFYADISSSSGHARMELSTDEIASGTIRIAADAAAAQFTLSQAVLERLNQKSFDITLVFATASESIVIPLSELPDDGAAIVQVGREGGSTKLAEVLAGLPTGVKAGPIRFEVTSGGPPAEGVTFSRYVERYINLGLSKISDSATVLQWDEELGELRFVPARFENEGVNTVAVIHSREDGVYLVVDQAVSFADMEGHWGRQEVERLAAKGIIQGRGAGQFDPSGSVTRAETAALLVRALGIVPSESASSFTDMEDKWYASSVAAAQKAGLITGYNDDTFRPDDKVTRQELAVMMGRAIAYAGGAGHKPTVRGHMADTDRIAPWALESVEQALELGIIKGDDSGSFRPQAAATRAEMAAMLSRMLQSLGFI